MPFAAAARETLHSQLAALFVWAAFLPQPDRAHEHHQMRIAVKRLRYTLDLFGEILPAPALGCLDDLKRLQEELGALHDLDTLFLSIEDAMLHETPATSTKRYEVKRARLAQQRTSLEALLSATAAERDAQHQRSLNLWQETLAHDAFAPLQATLHALDAVPDSRPVTGMEPKA
jgi:CHAD domain-containing protein